MVKESKSTKLTVDQRKYLIQRVNDRIRDHKFSVSKLNIEVKRQAAIAYLTEELGEDKLEKLIELEMKKIKIDRELRDLKRGLPFDVMNIEPVDGDIYKWIEVNRRAILDETIRAQWVASPKIQSLTDRANLAETKDEAEQILEELEEATKEATIEDKLEVAKSGKSEAKNTDSTFKKMITLRK